MIGSVRVATALAALSRGALGRDAAEGRALLWAVFAEAYGEPLAGPGSWDAAFEDEFAALVFDLFVGAAAHRERSSAAPLQIRMQARNHGVAIVATACSFMDRARVGSARGGPNRASTRALVHGDVGGVVTAARDDHCGVEGVFVIGHLTGRGTLQKLAPPGLLATRRVSYRGR